MEKSKKLRGKELKAAVERIVNRCESLAESSIKNWKPVNPEWDTIDGCAYLRLSTDEQVLVDQGSLEQQVHIAVAEAQARSHQNKVNYRIKKFYIEPGITGTHDDRPKFILLKKSVKNRIHKFIVMKEISRLTRDAKTWFDFFQLCNKNDCEVVIRGFPLNLNDPSDVLKLGITAVFAEYESNQIGRRGKENIFSAFINSKKFNSTHQILGLDPLIINGVKVNGFYQVNHSEIKTVVWIMETFLRLGSYPATLEEIERHGVVNKSGKAFEKDSLKRLLTNLRYIGCWELNAENKHKNQERLQPYERYAYIEDFPHGCVVNKELFDKVQRKVRSLENNKDKNTGLKRNYPLSGILKHEKSGEKFGGSSGTSAREKRYGYYLCPKPHNRIPADPLEAEVKRIVGNLIGDSREIQEAIKRRCMEAETTAKTLEQEMCRIHDELTMLQAEFKELNQNLSFLTKGASESEADQFREQFRSQFSELRQRIIAKKNGLELITSKRRKVEEDTFDWKELADKARKTLELIEEKDPTALKNAYRELFEAILVGDPDAEGVRELKFVLRDDFAEAAYSATPAETFSIIEKMG